MSKTSKGMCEAQARKKKRKQAARAKRAYRKAFARALLMEAYGRTFDATRVHGTMAKEAGMLEIDLWMEEVNALCVDKTGLDTDDQPDFGWLDLWDEGLSPEDAFEIFWEENEDELG